MGVGGTGGERPRRPQDRLRRKTLPNLRRKLPLALGPEGRLEVSGELDPWWPLRPCHRRLQHLCRAPGLLARQAFLFLRALIGS